MPIATTDEQLALQASIREWAKRARSIELVRGLEPRAGLAQDGSPAQDHGLPPDQGLAQDQGWRRARASRRTVVRPRRARRLRDRPAGRRRRCRQRVRTRRRARPAHRFPGAGPDPADDAGRADLEPLPGRAGRQGGAPHDRVRRHVGRSRPGHRHDHRVTAAGWFGRAVWTSRPGARWREYDTPADRRVGHGGRIRRWRTGESDR